MKPPGRTARPPEPVGVEVSSPSARAASTGAAQTLLTVVVVSHNGCELLRDCLASLRAEGELVPLEVTVVDNDSSDGAAEMVQREHPWARLIESGGNLGYAKAANMGIRAACSEFILVLNPDTVVPAGTLARCLAEMAARPRVGVLGCKLVRRDGTIDHACKRNFPTPISALVHMTGTSRLPFVSRSGGYTAQQLGDDEEGPVDAINGAFMMVRARAVEKVGLLDESYWMYGEDLDWCHRFWTSGWTVLYWPRVTIVHVKGGISGAHRTWRTNLAFHRAMWRFYRTHTARDYPAALAPVVWTGIWAKLGVSAGRSAAARSVRGLASRPDSTAGRGKGVRRSTDARRLRVLVVLPALEVGGVERHALTMYGALDRTRFKVRILCIKGRGALYHEAAASGLDVRALDAGEGNVSIARSALTTYRMMRSFAPDVAVTTGFAADVVGRVAATAARVPAILTWKHNLGHVEPFGRRERFAERLLGRLTTRYLAVADAQVAYLTSHLRLPRERIEVIHNSVEAPSGAPDAAAAVLLRNSIGLDESDVVLGVIAALRPWKDHATLLRAFRRVRDADGRAHLLVIGDGEERERLAALAARLGVAAAVHFLGDRRDVDDLLGIIHVVVLASHSVECLPFAILEAMSRSRPAVATDIGALAELIEPGVTGFLVPPRDEEALADALLMIVRSPDRGASLGRAAHRRLVEHFPLHVSVRRIEDAMEAAVAAAGRLR